MNKMKRVISFLLALSVLMFNISGVTAFANFIFSEYYADWNGEIEEGDYLTVHIPEDYAVYYTFQPTSSGCYVVDTYIKSSCNNADPEIFIDSNHGSMLSDDVRGNEAAICFYGLQDEYYNILLSDDNGAEVEYEVSISMYCADFNYDSLCDGCGTCLCGCDCHQGGIVGFFWSIKNFFNRLFRINEVCECGAYHW